MLERLKKIKILILDVDGVMTDGHIHLTGGVETLTFDVKDGHGIKMLMKHDIQVAILSSRKSRCAEERALNLGIPYTSIFLGKKDKEAGYVEMAETLDFKDEEVAYMGDDLPDIPVLMRVGFSVAVADASPAVLNAARYLTTKSGGHGAVREVCDLLLSARGVL